MPSDTTPAWLIPGVQCADPVDGVLWRCTHRQGSFLLFTGFLPGASTRIYGIERHDSGAVGGGIYADSCARAVANGPDLADRATMFVVDALIQDGLLDDWLRVTPIHPVSSSDMAESVKAREKMIIEGILAVERGNRE